MPSLTSLGSDADVFGNVVRLDTLCTGRPLPIKRCTLLSMYTLNDHIAHM
jgi:hypothetical protein